MEIKEIHAYEDMVEILFSRYAIKIRYNHKKNAFMAATNMGYDLRADSDYVEKGISKKKQVQDVAAECLTKAQCPYTLEKLKPTNDGCFDGKALCWITIEDYLKWLAYVKISNIVKGV